MPCAGWGRLGQTRAGQGRPRDGPSHCDRNQENVANYNHCPFYLFWIPDFTFNWRIYTTAIKCRWIISRSIHKDNKLYQYSVCNIGVSGWFLSLSTIIIRILLKIAAVTDFDSCFSLFYQIVMLIKNRCGYHKEMHVNKYWITW